LKESGTIKCLKEFEPDVLNRRGLKTQNIFKEFVSSSALLPPKNVAVFVNLFIFEYYAQRAKNFTSSLNVVDYNLLFFFVHRREKTSNASIPNYEDSRKKTKNYKKIFGRPRISFGNLASGFSHLCHLATRDEENIFIF